MQLMVTDQTRRGLLKAAFAGGAVSMMPLSFASAGTPAPALVGCAIRGREQFSAVVADESGMPLTQVPLPARGHGVAINTKSGHAAAFGRRPGTFFLVFDYRTGETVTLTLAAKDRHYYGHGVYSNDGRWLYATEGERGTSRGIIGVYDSTQQYRKVEEFHGFGLGPHEVILMPDDILAIGVGGVHTNGRAPLNLDSMQPSLSYLSPTGQLLDQVSLGDHHLSIRHLAHDGDHTVLCGQQYRGEPDEYPALLAMHTRGGAMIPLDAEPEEWARFNHYIASIAATEEWILATSPRGNCYGIWSKASRQLVELAALPDASGVVTADKAFRISSGSGNVITHPYPQAKQSVASGVMWDNHWSAIR